MRPSYKGHLQYPWRQSSALGVASYVGGTESCPSRTCLGAGGKGACWMGGMGYCLSLNWRPRVQSKGILLPWPITDPASKMVLQIEWPANLVQTVLKHLELKVEIHKQNPFCIHRKWTALDRYSEDIEIPSRVCRYPGWTAPDGVPHPHLVALLKGTRWAGSRCQSKQPGSISAPFPCNPPQLPPPQAGRSCSALPLTGREGEPPVGLLFSLLC